MGAARGCSLFLCSFLPVIYSNEAEMIMEDDWDSAFQNSEGPFLSGFFTYLVLLG
jgi:hypothetical protein